MPLFVGASESYDTDAWEAYNLKKENAKLREELADAPKCETCEAMLDCDECLRADGSHKERRRLKAENAKLRELVADAWGYINHTADASWTHTRRKEARDSLSDRIRELGIEVD